MVKRYELYKWRDDADMEPQDDGPWVEYSDYESLLFRHRDLVAAAKPFADKDECDEVGCIIGYDDDHTAQCAECQRVLALRKALFQEKQ